MGRLQFHVTSQAPHVYRTALSLVTAAGSRGGGRCAAAATRVRMCAKAELLAAVLNRGAEGLHYVTNHRLPSATTPQEAVDVIACTLIELALGRLIVGKWLHPASAYITGISVGILIAQAYSPAYKSKINDEFKSVYKDKQKKDPPQFSAQAFAGIQVFVEALRALIIASGAAVIIRFISA